MPRQPRQVFPDHLTEITIKTYQARFLLAPNRRVNSLFLGVLGKAQEKYDMTLCAVVVLSNHFHVQLVPRSGEQLKAFCQFLNSNVSTEIGKLRRWPGGIFGQRYGDVVVTQEEAAQVDRLRYLLSNSVKEGLVRRPQDWPGVHCAKALLRKSFEMTGQWVDRSSLFEERRQAKTSARKHRVPRPAEADFTTEQVVRLSKIPCWAHLTDEEYFQAVRELVDKILEDYEEVRAKVPSDAPRRICRQDPEHRPGSTLRRPKPVCHAASRSERLRYRQIRTEWLAQYRAASDELRAGNLLAIRSFPAEAFLPTMPRETAESALPP